MDENNTASEEKEWVRLAQEGAAEAFGAIFDLYYPMIFRLAYRLCGQREDAEDVAQDTFVKAARSLSRYRGDSSFRTWLYRIAVNAASDYRRKNRRHIAETLPAEIEAEKTRPSPMSERLLEALEQLPPAQRSAIVLTAFEGMNHAEAAAVLGCAESTVSWRIFSAKKMLKKTLETPALETRRHDR